MRKPSSPLRRVVAVVLSLLILPWQQPLLALADTPAPAVVTGFNLEKPREALDALDLRLDALIVRVKSDDIGKPAEIAALPGDLLKLKADYQAALDGYVAAEKAAGDGAKAALAPLIVPSKGQILADAMVDNDLAGLRKDIDGMLAAEKSFGRLPSEIKPEEWTALEKSVPDFRASLIPMSTRVEKARQQVVVVDARPSYEEMTAALNTAFQNLRASASKMDLDGLLAAKPNTASGDAASALMTEVAKKLPPGDYKVQLAAVNRKLSGYLRSGNPQDLQAAVGEIDRLYDAAKIGKGEREDMFNRIGKAAKDRAAEGPATLPVTSAPGVALSQAPKAASDMQSMRAMEAVRLELADPAKPASGEHAGLAKALSDWWTSGQKAAGPAWEALLAKLPGAATATDPAGYAREWASRTLGPSWTGDASPEDLAGRLGAAAGDWMTRAGLLRSQQNASAVRARAEAALASARAAGTEAELSAAETELTAVAGLAEGEGEDLAAAKVAVVSGRDAVAAKRGASKAARDEATRTARAIYRSAKDASFAAPEKVEEPWKTLGAARMAEWTIGLARRPSEQSFEGLAEDKAAAGVEWDGAGATVAGALAAQYDAITSEITKVVRQTPVADGADAAAVSARYLRLVETLFGKSGGSGAWDELEAYWTSQGSTLKPSAGAAREKAANLVALLRALIASQNSIPGLGQEFRQKMVDADGNLGLSGRMIVESHASKTAKAKQMGEFLKSLSGILGDPSLSDEQRAAALSGAFDGHRDLVAGGDLGTLAASLTAKPAAGDPQALAAFNARNKPVIGALTSAVDMMIHENDKPGESAAPLNRGFAQYNDFLFLLLRNPGPEDKAALEADPKLKAAAAEFLQAYGDATRGLSDEGARAGQVSLAAKARGVAELLPSLSRKRDAVQAQNDYLAALDRVGPERGAQLAAERAKLEEDRVTLGKARARAAEIRALDLAITLLKERVGGLTGVERDAAEAALKEKENAREGLNAGYAELRRPLGAYKLGGNSKADYDRAEQELDERLAAKKNEQAGYERSRQILEEALSGMESQAGDGRALTLDELRKRSKRRAEWDLVRETREGIATVAAAQTDEAMRGRMLGESRELRDGMLERLYYGKYQPAASQRLDAMADAGGLDAAKMVEAVSGIVDARLITISLLERVKRLSGRKPYELTSFDADLLAAWTKRYKPLLEGLAGNEGGRSAGNVTFAALAADRDPAHWSDEALDDDRRAFLKMFDVDAAEWRRRLTWMGSGDPDAAKGRAQLDALGAKWKAAADAAGPTADLYRRGATLDSPAVTLRALAAAAAEFKRRDPKWSDFTVLDEGWAQGLLAQADPRGAVRAFTATLTEGQRERLFDTTYREDQDFVDRRMGERLTTYAADNAATLGKEGTLARGQVLDLLSAFQRKRAAETAWDGMDAKDREPAQLLFGARAAVASELMRAYDRRDIPEIRAMGSSNPNLAAFLNDKKITELRRFDQALSSEYLDAAANETKTTKVAFTGVAMGRTDEQGRKMLSATSRDGALSVTHTAVGEGVYQMTVTRSQPGREPQTTQTATYASKDGPAFDFSDKRMISRTVVDGTQTVSTDYDAHTQFVSDSKGKTAVQYILNDKNTGRDANQNQTVLKTNPVTGEYEVVGRRSLREVYEKGAVVPGRMQAVYEKAEGGGLWSVHVYDTDTAANWAGRRVEGAALTPKKGQVPASFNFAPPEGEISEERAKLIAVGTARRVEAITPLGANGKSITTLTSAYLEQQLNQYARGFKSHGGLADMSVSFDAASKSIQSTIRTFRLDANGKRVPITTLTTVAQNTELEREDKSKFSGLVVFDGGKMRGIYVDEGGAAVYMGASVQSRTRSEAWHGWGAVGAFVMGEKMYEQTVFGGGRIKLKEMDVTPAPRDMPGLSGYGLFGVVTLAPVADAIAIGVENAALYYGATPAQAKMWGAVAGAIADVGLGLVTMGPAMLKVLQLAGKYGKYLKLAADGYFAYEAYVGARDSLRVMMREGVSDQEFADALRGLLGSTVNLGMIAVMHVKTRGPAIEGKGGPGEGARVEPNGKIGPEPVDKAALDATKPTEKPQTPPATPENNGKGTPPPPVPENTGKGTTPPPTPENTGKGTTPPPTPEGNGKGTPPAPTPEGNGKPGGPPPQMLRVDAPHPNVGGAGESLAKGGTLANPGAAELPGGGGQTRASANGGSGGETGGKGGASPNGIGAGEAGAKPAAAAVADAAKPAALAAPAPEAASAPKPASVEGATPHDATAKVVPGPAEAAASPKPANADGHSAAAPNEGMAEASQRIAPLEGAKPAAAGKAIFEATTPEPAKMKPGTAESENAATEPADRPQNEQRQPRRPNENQAASASPELPAAPAPAAPPARVAGGETALAEAAGSEPAAKAPAPAAAKPAGESRVANETVKPSAGDTDLLMRPETTGETRASRPAAEAAPRSEPGRVAKVAGVVESGVTGALDWVGRGLERAAGKLHESNDHTSARPAVAEGVAPQSMPARAARFVLELPQKFLSNVLAEVGDHLRRPANMAADAGEAGFRDVTRRPEFRELAERQNGGKPLEPGTEIKVKVGVDAESGALAFGDKPTTVEVRARVTGDGRLELLDIGRAEGKPLSRLAGEHLDWVADRALGVEVPPKGIVRGTLERLGLDAPEMLGEKGFREAAKALPEGSGQVAASYDPRTGALSFGEPKPGAVKVMLEVRAGEGGPEITGLRAEGEGRVADAATREMARRVEVSYKVAKVQGQFDALTGSAEGRKALAETYDRISGRATLEANFDPASGKVRLGRSEGGINLDLTFLRGEDGALRLAFAEAPGRATPLPAALDHNLRLFSMRGVAPAKAGWFSRGDEKAANFDERLEATRKLQEEHYRAELEARNYLEKVADRSGDRAKLLSEAADSGTLRHQALVDAAARSVEFREQAARARRNVDRAESEISSLSKGGRKALSALEKPYADYVETSRQVDRAVEAVKEAETKLNAAGDSPEAVAAKAALEKAGLAFEKADAAHFAAADAFSRARAKTASSEGVVDALVRRESALRREAEAVKGRDEARTDMRKAALEAGDARAVRLALVEGRAEGSKNALKTADERLSYRRDGFASDVGGDASDIIRIRRMLGRGEAGAGVAGRRSVGQEAGVNHCVLATAADMYARATGHPVESAMSFADKAVRDALTAKGENADAFMDKTAVNGMNAAQAEFVMNAVAEAAGLKAVKLGRGDSPFSQLAAGKQLAVMLGHAEGAGYGGGGHMVNLSNWRMAENPLTGRREAMVDVADPNTRVLGRDGAGNPVYEARVYSMRAAELVPQIRMGFDGNEAHAVAYSFEGAGTGPRAPPEARRLELARAMGAGEGIGAAEPGARARKPAGFDRGEPKVYTADYLPETVYSREIMETAREYGLVYEVSPENAARMKPGVKHNYVIAENLDGTIEMTVGRLSAGNSQEVGVKHSAIGAGKRVVFSGEVIVDAATGKPVLDFNSGTYSQAGLDPRWAPTAENARALAAYGEAIFGRPVEVVDHFQKVRIDPGARGSAEISVAPLPKEGIGAAVKPPEGYSGRRGEVVELANLNQRFRDPAQMENRRRDGQLFTMAPEKLAKITASAEDVHNYVITRTPEGLVEMTVGRYTKGDGEYGVKHAQLANGREVLFSGEIARDAKTGDIRLDFNSGTYSKYGKNHAWDPTPENARALAAHAKAIIGREVTVWDHFAKREVPLDGTVAMAQALGIRGRPVGVLSPETFRYDSPIRIQAGAKTFEIISYADLARRAPEYAKGINSKLEYYLLDAQHPTDLKGLRNGEVVTVGRDTPQRFNLPENFAKKHFQIERRGGEFLISDLGSFKGTEVAARPEPASGRELEPGAAVKLAADPVVRLELGGKGRDGGRRIEILSREEMIKRWPILDAQLNAKLDRFIVDPTKPEQFKGLRVGEEVNLGRGEKGRFDFGTDVSRQHLSIKRTAEGYELTDRNSTNGTRVLDLEPGKPAPAAKAAAPAEPLPPSPPLRVDGPSPKPGPGERVADFAANDPRFYARIFEAADLQRMGARDLTPNKPLLVPDAGRVTVELGAKGSSGGAKLEIVSREELVRRWPELETTVTRFVDRFLIDPADPSRLKALRPGEEVSLGRSDQGRFKFNADVSRNHATIKRVEGGYEIVDQGSTNGTRVRSEAPAALAEKPRSAASKPEGIGAAAPPESPRSVRRTGSNRGEGWSVDGRPAERLSGGAFKEVLVHPADASLVLKLFSEMGAKDTAGSLSEKRREMRNLEPLLAIERAPRIVDSGALVMETPSGKKTTGFVVQERVVGREVGELLRDPATADRTMSELRALCDDLVAARVKLEDRVKMHENISIGRAGKGGPEKAWVLDAGEATRVEPQGLVDKVLGRPDPLRLYYDSVLKDFAAIKRGAEPVLAKGRAREGIGAAADTAPYKRYFSDAEIRAAHPEPASGGVYHDWQHTVKVADMAGEFAKARGLPAPQAKFVSEVALLHDFDPSRSPGMPARVPATLEALRADFAGTKSLTGEPGRSVLKERFGWSEAQLKMAEAIIQRTEFPFGDTHPSPAYAKKSPLAHYQEMLAGLSPADRAFVLREAPLLSEYADKSSWYATEDFAGAHKVVEGLVNEINRATGKQVVSAQTLGTSGFLKVVGEPASFAHDVALAEKYGVDLKLPNRAEAFKILPEKYGRVFEANLKGFAEFDAASKAGDAAAFDKARAVADAAVRPEPRREGIGAGWNIFGKSAASTPERGHAAVPVAKLPVEPGGPKLDPLPEGLRLTGGSPRPGQFAAESDGRKIVLKTDASPNEGAALSLMAQVQLPANVKVARVLGEGPVDPMAMDRLAGGQGSRANVDFAAIKRSAAEGRRTLAIEAPGEGFVALSDLVAGKKLPAPISQADWQGFNDALMALGREGYAPGDLSGVRVRQTTVDGVTRTEFLIAEAGNATHRGSVEALKADHRALKGLSGVGGYERALIASKALAGEGTFHDPSKAAMAKNQAAPTQAMATDLNALMKDAGAGERPPESVRVQSHRFTDLKAAAEFLRAPGGMHLLERTSEGLAGDTVKLDIAGETWYGKRVSKKLGDSIDEGLRGLSPAERRGNELAMREIVRRFFGDSFKVAPEAISIEHNGEIFVLTKGASAAPDPARLKTMTAEQRADYALLRLVFRAEDLNRGNVLFDKGAKPTLIDFEKVIAEALDPARVAREADNEIFVKGFPIVSLEGNDPGVYRARADALRARFKSPEFIAEMRGLLESAGWEPSRLDAYMKAVETNLGNFEQNVQHYIDAANKVAAKRRREGIGAAYQPSRPGASDAFFDRIPDEVPLRQTTDKASPLRQIEISLEARGKKEVFQEAQEILYTDGLTGLPNRAFIMSTAEALLKGVKDPTVAMLDMNNFGAVNAGLADVHGPVLGKELGDGMLADAGPKIAAIARKTGVHAARLGGEEIVVFGSINGVIDFSAAMRVAFPPEQVLRDAKVGPKGEGIVEGGREKAAIDAAMTRMHRTGPVGDFTYGIARVEGRGFDATLKAADGVLNKAKAQGLRGEAVLEAPGGVTFTRLREISTLAQRVGELGDLPPLAPRPNRLDAIRNLKAKLNDHEYAVFLEAAFKDPLTLTKTAEWTEMEQVKWEAAYDGRGQAAMISARNFKAVNDVLGHDAGDLYLKRLGVISRLEVNRLRKLGYSVEEPVRVGGKEFLIVGRDAAKVAALVGEKFAAKLEAGEVLPREQLERLRAEAPGRGLIPQDRVGKLGTLREVSQPFEGGFKKTYERLILELEAVKVHEDAPKTKPEGIGSAHEEVPKFIKDASKTPKPEDLDLTRKPVEVKMTPAAPTVVPMTENRLTAHVMAYELSDPAHGKRYIPRLILGGGHTEKGFHQMLRLVGESLELKRAQYQLDLLDLKTAQARGDSGAVRKLTRILDANKTDLPPAPGTHWSERPDGVKWLPDYPNGVRRVVLPEAAYQYPAWSSMGNMKKWVPGYEQGGKTFFPAEWTAEDIRAATTEVADKGALESTGDRGVVKRGSVVRQGKSVLVEVQLDASGRTSTSYPAWNQ